VPLLPPLQFGTSPISGRISPPAVSHHDGYLSTQLSTLLDEQPPSDCSSDDEPEPDDHPLFAAASSSERGAHTTPPTCWYVGGGTEDSFDAGYDSDPTEGVDSLPGARDPFGLHLPEAPCGAACEVDVRGHVIPLCSLQPIRKLGRGAFADVWLARYRGGFVAVKQLRSNGHSCVRQVFAREVRNLRHSKCPAVVRLLGVCTKPHHCLVLEFMQGGSLADHIRARCAPLSMHEVLGISLDVCVGMAHVHSQDVIHRDLTSENILLEGTVQNLRSAVVADFGVSRRFCGGYGPTRMTPTGHPHYTAPEVARREPYSTSADVFSFGLVLWEMLMGKLVFSGHTWLESTWLKRQCRGFHQLDELDEVQHTWPHSVAAQLRKLVHSCLHCSPEMRPTFASLVSSIMDLQKRLASSLRRSHEAVQHERDEEHLVSLEEELLSAKWSHVPGCRMKRTKIPREHRSSWRSSFDQLPASFSPGGGGGSGIGSGSGRRRQSRSKQRAREITDKMYSLKK